MKSPYPMALSADTLDRVSKAKKAESDAEQVGTVSGFAKNRPERMVGRIEKAEAAGKTKKAARIKANLPSATLQWQERQSSKAERKAKPYTSGSSGAMETLERLKTPKKTEMKHAVKTAAKIAGTIATVGSGVAALFGAPTFGGNMGRWLRGRKG